MVRVIGLFLLVLLMIVLLIYVNMRKKTESDMSVLMRIMTNYLQMLTATASFNIGYPTYLLSFYEPGLFIHGGYRCSYFYRLFYFRRTAKPL